MPAKANTAAPIQRMFVAIRRAAAWFRARSLETTLQGQNDALEFVRDAETRQHIILARSVTQRELAKARADYISLLPVGDRPTFEVA